MTQQIYAVGDIHGQLSQLERVLTLIEKDGGSASDVVFLGDYTDRGPDSQGVIDLLIDGAAQGRPWTFLKGNHDRMFCWFMRDYPKHDAFLPVSLYWLHQRLGGDTTLASYGVEFTENTRQLEVHRMARERVPASHVQFLEQTRLSFETDEVFFAHAGIQPGVSLANQSEHDLLWIRQEFHNDPRSHPKLIVHGHTPVDRAQHYGNRINLDSGAGYGRDLTVAVFEGPECWCLTDSGRVPVFREPAG